MPITKSAKAPRGTNIVVAGFMEALSGIPDSSVQDVGKAALAKIRDQMKEMKAAAKAERSTGTTATRATKKAAPRATVSRKTKAASSTRKAGAKRSYTRRAAIGSITPTNDAATDGMVN